MRRSYLVTFLRTLIVTCTLVFSDAFETPQVEAPVTTQKAGKVCKLDDPACKVSGGTAATGGKLMTSGTISMVMPQTPTAPGDMIMITLQGVPTASLPKLKQWVWPNEGTQLIVGQGLQFNDPAFMVFSAKNAGTYKFIVVAPDGTGDVLTASSVLIVGQPTPPGPGPGPGPGPDPKPPVPPTKLRVLVLYDPAAVDKMSEPQREVIYSVAKGSMRDYIDAHATIDDVKDAEGGTTQLPARRIWPINVDAAQAGALWAPLLKAADGKPSIVVQAGSNIQRFDLPATNEDALKVLEPLGGK
jgi:hypothetical protein